MDEFKNFIEDWIEMRSKFQQQLKMLKTGSMRSPIKTVDSLREADVSHIENCIEALNSLLKDHASAHT